MQSRTESKLSRREPNGWSCVGCALLLAFGKEFYGIKEIRYLTP